MGFYDRVDLNELAKQWFQQVEFQRILRVTLGARRVLVHLQEDAVHARGHTGAGERLDVRSDRRRSRHPDCGANMSTTEAVAAGISRAVGSVQSWPENGWLRRRNVEGTPTDPLIRAADNIYGPGTQVGEESVFWNLRQGPDGLLYIVTDEAAGAVHRRVDLARQVVAVRPGRHDRYALAADLRSAAGNGADHVGGHLLRCPVWRLHHRHSRQPAGRAVVGGDRP